VADFGELGWVDDGGAVGDGDGDGLVVAPVGDVLVVGVGDVLVVGVGDVLVADADLVGVRVGVARGVEETLCCTVPTFGELVSGGGGGLTCR
jgi:hypothetical protein